MRLWHQKLITKLPRQQLLGQHRECCALRGRGWNNRKSVVDYIFKYSPARLIAYHYHVMLEMEARGYNVTRNWYLVDYRGKNLPFLCGWEDYDNINEEMTYWLNSGDIIFPEHDEQYLKECVQNLLEKGAVCKYFPV